MTFELPTFLPFHSKCVGGAQRVDDDGSKQEIALPAILVVWSVPAQRSWDAKYTTLTITHIKCLIYATTTKNTAGDDGDAEVGSVPFLDLNCLEVLLWSPVLDTLNRTMCCVSAMDAW